MTTEPITLTPPRLSDQYETALHDASERQRKAGKGGFTKKQIEAFTVGFRAGAEAKADELQIEVSNREFGRGAA